MRQRGTPFRDRADAQAARKMSYICPSCLLNHGMPRPRVCVCGEEQFLYFASKLEAMRYVELRTMQKFGEIEDLEIQPRFRIEVGEKKISEYRADFRYRHRGAVVIEDVKGLQTDLFRLKRKLVEALYGVEITVLGKGPKREGGWKVQ